MKTSTQGSADLDHVVEAIKDLRVAKLTFSDAGHNIRRTATANAIYATPVHVGQR
jgi:hypothetical protein